MKLNTHKIQKELERLGWSYTKLGKAMGRTRQYVSYKLRYPESSNLRTVSEFAQTLELDERDLIK